MLLEYKRTLMAGYYKHCHTQECYDSANMLCDHESLAATQYYLDQTKQFLARFKPQEARNQFSGVEMLAFDRGLWTGEYGKKLCDLKKRGGWDGVPQVRNEMYMTPCTHPTYRNRATCDTKQCCSMSHQMFDNHTRQGTGKL